MHADIIVIGGGLIGLSSALHLARQGKKVIVLEKDFVGKNASGVNAGGVRSLKRDLNEIPLIHGALDMWHRMPEIVGSDCGFYETGYVVAAENDEDMQELEKRAATTRALGYDNEILIDKETLNRLAPPIAAHCVGGIMSNNDGHANPAETCRAFCAACLDEGVLIHMGCEALEINIKPNGFMVKTSSAGVLESEQILNCAGAWAGNVGEMIGDRLPITPVGPSVMVTAPMPRLLSPFITANKRKLWFNQARNGSILICGGYLADIDLEKGKTRLRFSELQKCVRVAYDLLKIVENIPLVRAWAGLDGDSPDKFPLIGYSSRVPGFMHACGFSKHGFALSPMVGSVVSSLMLGKKPEVSIAGLELDRFGPADGAAENNGQYEKNIC